jgi:3',5'-cyclic AMP phosphodiesterase CpdA
VVADDLNSMRDMLPTQKLTVEAWAEVNAPIRDGSFIGTEQRKGSAGKGWSLGTDEGRFTFTLATKGSTDDQGRGRFTTLKSKTDHQSGRMCHVVGTYDGKTMRIYVNGKLESESAEQSGDILYPDKAPVTLAGLPNSGSNVSILARIKEVNLYDKVATSEGVAGLFAHNGSLATAEPQADEDANFDWVVRPYQQYPTLDSMTIMWETTRTATSVVYFGPDKNHLTKAEGTVTRNPQSLIHRVRLSGLKPDSHYVFRTESVDSQGRKLESPLLTFRTAPDRARAIRFTIVGDTQDQPAVNSRIANHMWNERPDFFMIVGDLVGTGANKKHWTNDFFGSMRPLFDRVPLIPVIGNHEGDARLYYDYMSVPEPEYWYRFTYGPAEFFVVDSNRNVKPGSAQYQWLESALASSKARWKFVAHHHPPFSSDDDDFGNLWEGQSTRGDVNLKPVTQLYEKYGVDVVWTGHIHSYERTWPIVKGQASPKGPIYVVCGGGGGGLETHGPTRPEFSNRIRHGHHYCVVSINGKTFEMSAFDIEGRMFDNLKIEKR